MHPHSAISENFFFQPRYGNFYVQIGGLYFLSRFHPGQKKTIHTVVLQKICVDDGDGKFLYFLI